MERLFKQILPTIVAIGAGILTLVGYLVPAPDLVSLLVRWAVLVAAFALVLGSFNVLRVHSSRFFRARKGWPYSLVLLITALAAFGVTTINLLPGLLNDPNMLPAGILDIVGSLSEGLFSYVIIPLEAGAAGIIAFTLAFASFRVMRSNKRNTVESFIFVFFALITLLAATPLPDGGLLAMVRERTNPFVLAGMRGLLLGVGIGTLVVGVRVIIGLDRPHSDI
jgi:hypothetical protein